MARTRPLLALLTTGWAAAVWPASAQPAVSPAVEAYAEAITGRFSSAGQHAADPRYAEVEGNVTRIWLARTDGIWIYQEQAILSGASDRAAARARPYFQRISRLFDRGDGSIGRETFPLLEAGRFVGLGMAGYRGPIPTPADLGPAGCPLVIEAAGHGHFTGTSGDCPSSHRGAVRMRSVSVVAGTRLVNWDRGFDAAGRQVWGPEAGGYVFELINR